MLVNWTIFLLGLFNLVIGSGSGSNYEVPEPSIEVFAPKGLRISIEDSRNIQKVEFILSVPGVSQQLVHRAHKTEHGRWTYWNPDVVVHLCERIVYKIIVKHLDLYCTREGVYIVQKRIGANGTNCTEDYYDRRISEANKFDHRLERIVSEKSSNMQSSYSKYQDSDFKPITKSSSMTASGTFYIKPSGELEASGYKSGSTFDSTKSEGEQWKHYRSNLTPEELEEMRRTKLKGLSLAGKLFPEAMHGINFGEEFRQTHKTSSYSQTSPELRFRFEDFNQDGSMISRNNHLGPAETMYKTIEFVREEHLPPGVRSETTFDSVQSSHSIQHHKELPTAMAMEASESQNYRTRVDSYNPREYNFRAQSLADNRQSYGSRVDSGNIFTLIRSPEPRSPGECIMIPGSDYRPSNDLQHVEKTLQEHRCLSYLAEKMNKKDMSEVKWQTQELTRKLELLERRISRWETSCKCV